MLASRFKRLASWQPLFILLSFLALGLGTGIYYLMRPIWASYLFQENLYNQLPENLAFRNLAFNLPSLCHSFAFSLLSVVILGLSPWAIRFSLGFWLVFESLAEIAQAEHLNPLWQHLLANTDTSLGRVFYGYLSLGRYDPWDLLYTLFGVILAYGLIAFTRRNHDKDPQTRA
ncbi:MAG: hypothetical protein R2880_06795 [Deinococcales bacterium]